MILRLVLLAIPTLLFAPFTLAESISFTIGNTEYTVSTGTASGTCSSRSEGPGLPTYYSCFDGAAEAFGDTSSGCDDIELTGQCWSGEDPPTPLSTTQVDCAGGSSFTITTGDDEGSCTVTDSGGSRSGSCTSGSQGENTAQADCNSGCGNTSGSGCCCETSSCGDTCFSG